MPEYPEAIEIQPLPPLDIDVTVPGSKSLTNRALIVAGLATGVTQLEGGLVAEDSEVMIRALGALGIPVEVSGTTFRVHGQGGRIPVASAELDLRLSGTSIRFLTAMVALGQGRYRLDGNARMRQRPIQDLLEALKGLGVQAVSAQGTGCPPVEVEAAGMAGGRTQISGRSSSQYLSALLMAAPCAKAPVTIEVIDSLQSKPFVDMTLALMADFGVHVARDGYQRFELTPAAYQAGPYQIEGDAMAAGYFWAAAAIAGGRVRVMNVGQGSSQGDRRLAEVLAEMGCALHWTSTSCEVSAPPGGALKGGRFDLNDMPDQAQTLAVVALFAEGPTRIENIWNLRIKETDRLAALRTELSKLGAKVEEGEDFVVVHPPARLRPASIDTYGDHRMAMAFALVGLRARGVVIRDPACVAKTFPDFFDRLAALSPKESVS